MEEDAAMGWALRMTSAMAVLDRFVYDPDTHQGDVAISFAKGAFRFIRGEIKNKQNVTLRTPTASMVIRGTSDTPPPDWVRGRNGDHEPASDRGSNRD